MIDEFVKALRDPRTYWPPRNAYAIFGLLWGLPIPVFSVLLHAWIVGSLRAPLEAWPLHLIFLAHPLLFMVLFGAMGTMQAWKSEALNEVMTRLETSADTDALTGLPNHRHLRRRLSEEIERARRTGEPLSVAIIDLDSFKPVNDRHGHLAGDAVLREVGRRLGATRREYDVVGRYGGDEFVIIFPRTTREGALVVAARTLERIGATPYEIVNADAVPLSASIGVAAFDGIQSVDSLLSYADQAMYTAKARGGNCIAIAEGVVRQ